MKRQTQLKIDDELIINRVKDDVLTDESDTSIFRANRVIYDKQIRALEVDDSEVIFNTLGLETAQARSTWHTRLFSLAEKQVKFKPTEKNDVEKVEKCQELFRWYIAEHIEGFSDFVVDFLMNLSDYGTAPAFIGWDRRESKNVFIKDYPVATVPDQMIGQPQLVDSNTGQPITQEVLIDTIFASDKWEVTKAKEVSEDRIEVTYKEHIDNPNNPEKQWEEKKCIIDFTVNERTGQIMAKVERPEVEYEGPVCAVMNYDKTFHPVDAKSVQTADHFIVESEITISELIEKRDRGIYPFSDEDLEDIKKNTEFQPSYNISSTERKEKSEAEGTAETLHPENYKAVKAYTAYYLFDVEGKGKTEQVIFTVLPKAHKVIRKQYLNEVFRHGKRPFVLGHWLKRKFRMLGIGLVEHLRPPQCLINDIRNNILEAMAYAMNPPGWYDPAGGGDNKPITVKPGQYLPFPGGSGQPPVTIPSAANFAPAIQMLLHQIESFQRQSNIAEQLQGQPGQVRTATATLKLIGESYQNMGLIIKNVLNALKEIYTQIWWLICAYMPEEMEYRITGPDGKYDFPTFTRQDLILKPDITIDINIEETSKEWMMAQATEMFQNLGNNQLYIQAGIVNQRNMFEHAKKYAESIGIKDTQVYITEPPQPEPPHDPDVENYLMVEGQEVVPSPLDDDMAHVQNHQQFPMQQAQVIPAENFSNVVMRIHNHNQMHNQQLQAKFQQQMMQQSMLSQMAMQTKNMGPQQGGQGEQQGRITAGPVNALQGAQATGMNQAMPGMGRI